MTIIRNILISIVTKITNVKYKKLMQNVQNVQMAKRTHIVNIEDFTNDILVLIIEDGWPS